MAQERAPFEIFRGSDAPSMMDHGCMIYEDMSPVIEEGLKGLAQHSAGGSVVDVPYSRPSMSLSTLRIKSGYTLPLHSHDCECLYYIAQGSIVIGTETLNAGDGFYVGVDVPYGYHAGPNGAIVLEFRSVERFNIKFMAKTEQSWRNLQEKLAAANPTWGEEELPALV